MTLKRVLLVFGVVLALTAVHAAAVTVIVDGRSVGNLQTFTFQDEVLNITTTDGATDPGDPDPDQYRLTVTKSGSGIVTSNPAGINCGSTCSSNFNQGQTVTLTAQPQSGWRFTGWSGCTSVSNQNCTVTMSQARTVTATFTQETSGDGNNCPNFSNVVRIDTPLMASRYNRQIQRPNPNDIFAYEFVALSNAQASFDVFITSSSRFGKFLSVSECAGDVKQTVEAAKPQGACWGVSPEGATLTLSTDPSADQRFYCILVPGKTYYFNVSSDLTIDPNDNRKSCTTTDNCSFYAEGFPF